MRFSTCTSYLLSFTCIVICISISYNLLHGTKCFDVFYSKNSGPYQLSLSLVCKNLNLDCSTIHLNLEKPLYCVENVSLPSPIELWFSSNRHNIIFYKTHKTCSSTVTGILWRLLCLCGEHSRNVSNNCFVPPPQTPGRTWDFNRMDHRSKILSSIGSGGRGPPFTAWIHHARGGVHHPFFDIIMNRGLNRFLTTLSIVRNPSRRFRSAWQWYDHSSRFNNITLEEFVKSTTEKRNLSAKSSSLITFISKLFSMRSDPIDGKKKNEKFDFPYRTGLDATFHELSGMKEEASEELKTVALLELIQSMFQQKLFLMVCERFDESVLVLRRMLGLPPLRILSDETIIAELALANEGGVCSESDFFRGKNVPMTEWLLYSHQKQQLQLRNGSDMDSELAQQLDRLQPFDTALHLVASGMLEHYLSVYNEGGQLSLEEDLMRYRLLLQRTQSICANQLPHLRKICNELRRDNSKAVEAHWNTTRSKDADMRR